jgi:hypothetical protein
MTKTGWIAEEPEAAGPDLPVTNMLLGMQQPGPGDTVARALALSDAADARAAREEAAAAPDPDERASGLVARGYSPGLASQLAQRLGDTMTEIEAEREKIEKGQRRQEHLHRAHAAGQITAWDIARGQDFDEGDPGRVAQLERRAAGLRRQIEDAQAAIAPPSRRREEDPLEAATRRAHEAFAEVTRARMAEAEARRLEPRPFVSVSRGAGRSTEHTADCWVCAEGRRMDAARYSEDDVAAYAPGEVITTGYQQGMAYR